MRIINIIIIILCSLYISVFGAEIGSHKGNSAEFEMADDEAAVVEDTWTLNFINTAKNSLFGFFGYGTDDKVNNITPQPSARSESQISSSECTERVEKAKELISSDKIDDAIDILLGILEMYPDDKDSYLPNMLIGTALLTVKNDPSPAVGFLYNAVILSNWTDTISIANLAAALSLDNDAVLAERVAMKGIDSKAEKSRFVLGQSLGRIYEAKGDYTGASDWYLMAALDNPSESVEPWIKASTMKFPPKAQDYEVAESVLLRAFPNHPNSAEILFLLAMALHRKDRLEQALQVYKRATVLDPSVKDLMAMYATALHATMRFEEALVAYQYAVDQAPKNSVLFANYAICLCDPAVGRMDAGRSMIALAKQIQVSTAAEDIQTAETMCGSAVKTDLTAGADERAPLTSELNSNSEL